MVLVETETGEIVSDLDADTARDLTDKIKVAVEGTWLLVKAAYEGRAWVALGYLNWDEYCTREFGTSRLKLPREERQEVVASLRESGLSIRAIAAATGLAKQTIADDLEVSQSRTPAEPGGFDLKPAEIDPETGDLPSQPEDDKRITGTDGKSYAAKDRAAVRARRKRIRELHTSGHSSQQIADDVGITRDNVNVALKAMGLVPRTSRDRGGGGNRSAGDALEKFVTSVSAFPVAIRTLRPTEARGDSRRDSWVESIDELVKALRALRAELVKGDINGEA